MHFVILSGAGCDRDAVLRLPRLLETSYKGLTLSGYPSPLLAQPLLLLRAMTAHMLSELRQYIIYLIWKPPVLGRLGSLPRM